MLSGFAWFLASYLYYETDFIRIWPPHNDDVASVFMFQGLDVFTTGRLVLEVNFAIRQFSI